MTLLAIIEELQDKADDVRKEIICNILDTMGVSYQRHRYESGENIIVPSSKAVEVGIGSHFDVEPGSPGANDNGSAIAVTLDLIRRFQQNPTKDIGVRYFFFDQEEADLKGSQEYVAEYGTTGLIGLYNMELVGAGDQIALWSVEEDRDTRLLRTFEAEAKALKVPTHRFPRIVARAADHLSFIRAGLMDSFTITVITQADLEVAPAYYRALEDGAPVKELWDIMQRAPVFKNYHQPTDLAEHLEEETLRMVSDLLYQSIRFLDNPGL
jgi:Zn-dependent M28 family amino/carboxypeptidase